MVRMNLPVAGIFAGFLFVLTGCSEEIECGTVHGTVTVDGRALSDIIVVFQPESGGDPSLARVSAEGSYRIVDGAAGKQTGGIPVGTYIVRVNNSPSSRDMYRIPEVYGAQSELRIDVVPGENTFDIAMKSR